MATREERIAEAQQVLGDLGLPQKQQNELAALVLLASCSLRPKAKWAAVASSSVRPHEILAFINQHYGKGYAENTRETVRKDVLHQFVAAALLVRNEDQPGRPTNSPNTNYRLSPLAVDTLRAFRTGAWGAAVERFLESAPSLGERYRRPRETAHISFALPDGHQYLLSPGRHNELQKAIVEQFLPTFVPDARVLYIGDTDRKGLLRDDDALRDLNLDVTDHNKLPDVILYSPSRALLVLIEAVTSRGPVSPKRWEELEAMLGDSADERAYVSAFATLKDFKAFIADIAWETEVWIAEIPGHMIHYNGEKFLGPQH